MQDCFLADCIGIESAAFPYRIALLKANVKTNRIKNTCNCLDIWMTICHKKISHKIQQHNIFYSFVHFLFCFSF